MAKRRSAGLRNWLETLPEDQTRRLRAWTARGILIVVAVSLFALLCHEGSQYAEDLPYWTVDPAFIHLAQRPSWISDDIENDIFDVPCLSRSFSIFEPGVTARIAAAIERSPWVRNVRAVRKQFPNRLDIEMELRKPVAYVDYRGTFHAVDRTGVRVPGSFRKLDDTPWRLPCILVADREPPDLGAQWDSDLVRCAVDVADALVVARDELPVQVAAIDVRSRWDRGKPQRNVTLYTLNGPRIFWGSPPDLRQHGEPTTDERVDNLIAFAALYDADLASLEYIDLRFGSTAWYRERPRLPTGALSASRTAP